MAAEIILFELKTFAVGECYSLNTFEKNILI
jgi:hypothetical protein